MKKNTLLILLLLAGLGGIAGLLYKTLGGERGERSLTANSADQNQTDTGSTGQSSGPGPLQPGEQALDGSGDSNESGSSRSLAQRRQKDASQRTYAGQIIFPVGTPADEELWIEAYDKPQSEKPLARTIVSSDGSYELPISKDLRLVYLRLDANYLHLDKANKVALLSSGKPLPTLEPTVGARIRLVLTPPLGVKEEWAEFEYSAFGWSSDISIWGGDRFTRKEEFKGYETTLNAVPLLDQVSLSLSSEYYSNESESTKALLPGEITDLRIQLKLAVMLSGQVLDIDGQPVHKALVEVSEDRWFRHDKLTDEQGKFSITGVGPSDNLRVRAWRKGYKRNLIELNQVQAGAQLDDLEFVLELGSGLGGRVLWPDGEPVTQGWIDLIVDGEEPNLTGRSFSGESKRDRPQRLPLGSEGKFFFSGLTPREFQLHAWGSERPDPDKAPNTEGMSGRERRKALREYAKRPNWHVEVSGSSGMEDLELVLEPGFAVNGSVVDDLGQPITNFMAQASRSGMGFDIGETQSFNSDKGLFRLQGLRKATYNISIQSKGFESAINTEMIAGPGQTEASERFVLNRLATIKGIVLSGDPSLKVKVTTKREDRQRWNMLATSEASDTTDKRAAFVLKNVAPGPLTLIAKAPGTSIGELRGVIVAPGEVLEGIEIPMAATATVKGFVYMPDGSPAEDWYINLKPESTDDSNSFESVKPNGEFAFTSVAAGRYRLEVYPDDKAQEGFKALHGEDYNWRGELNLLVNTEVAPGEVRQITIQTGSPTKIRVFGRVRQAGSAPTETATVSILPYGRSDRGSNGSAQTNADGEFEFNVQRGGRFLATCQPNQGIQSEQVVDIPDNAKEFEINFELSGGELVGRVLTAAGEPAPNHGIVLRSLAPSPSSAKTTSNENGEFRFISVPAGAYRLDATGDLGAGWIDPLEVIDGGQQVNVQLVPPTQLSGRVTYQTQPIRNCVVTVSTQSNGGGYQRTAFTNKEGEFFFEGLPTTQFFVRAQQSNLALAEPKRIQLKEGATTSVDLALSPGTKLHVRVFQSDGDPCNAHLSVIDSNGFDYAARNQSSFTNKSPAYVQKINAVPPGSYTVLANLPDGSFGRTNIHVEAHLAHTTDPQVVRVDLN